MIIFTGEPAAKKHEAENCKPLTQADYLHFFYVLAADFPGRFPLLFEENVGEEKLTSNLLIFVLPFLGIKGKLVLSPLIYLFVNK